MIESAVPVDFGNADEDGAVRLGTRGTMEFFDSNRIALVDGMKIVMSDGEVTAEGACELRDGIWVAKPTRWIQPA